VKVYLLCNHCCDETEILGVFSSKEAAEKFVDPRSKSISIEEHEVDPTLEGVWGPVFSSHIDPDFLPDKFNHDGSGIEELRDPVAPIQSIVTKGISTASGNRWMRISGYSAVSQEDADELARRIYAEWRATGSVEGAQVIDYSSKETA